MSPLTHLIGSWLVAAVATDNRRDRQLVTWAGVLPDADGLGLIPDVVTAWVTGQEATFHYYHAYHHLLLHGWPGAILITGLLTIGARQKWRTLVLCLVTFHLHLLCDLLGSRGPTVADLWPICYSEPLFRHPIWFWKHQWKLDGWQNQLVFLAVFVTALSVAIRKGVSFVELISSRLDRTFVSVLQNWRNRLGKVRRSDAK